MSFRRSIAALAVLALSVFSSGTVFAQSAGSGQALEISPPLVKQNAIPGKPLSFDIRIHNVSKSTLVTSASVDDFVANGEDGQAKVLVNESQPSPYSFKTWVQPISNLTLVAGEAKTVTVTMNVPTTASPGGHYGVVRFTASSPSAQGANVSLNASLGSLVLLTVPGKVTINASLVDFYAAQGATKHSLFQYGPVNFVERLQNKGNEHIEPTGTIRVTNMLGHQTAVLSINSQGGNILPASIRHFEQTLNKKSLFGRYTAEANIQYNGQTLSKTIHFWVIPYKLVAIVIGLLIVAIALIRVWVKKSAERIVRKTTSQPKKSQTKKAKRINRR